MAGLAEAVFRVGAAALILGHSSRKRPGAGAHLNGPVAGGAHVCVHTYPSVHVDGQARRTLAAERALGVDAASIHADTRRQAFIDV